MRPLSSALQGAFRGRLLGEAGCRTNRDSRDCLRIASPPKSPPKNSDRNLKRYGRYYYDDLLVTTITCGRTRTARYHSCVAARIADDWSNPAPLDAQK